MIWIASMPNFQLHFFLKTFKVLLLLFAQKQIQESSECDTEVTRSNGGQGYSWPELLKVKISTKKSEVSPLFYSTTMVTYQLSFYQFILQVIG